MATQPLTYFVINFAQVTAEVGVSLTSFYQLYLKLCFSLVLIRFSCCFPFLSEQMLDGWNFVSSNYHMT